MSNALKVGDRAKIVRDTDGRIYNGIGIPFVHSQDLYGREVEVLSVDEHWGNAVVRIKEGVKREIDQKCLERINPPRRTFEEIINELIEKPEIKATFPVLRKYKNGEVDLDDHKNERTITIWPDGDTNIHGLHEITAAQLAEISAACTEIAANYQAEHGEENKQ